MDNLKYWLLGNAITFAISICYLFLIGIFHGFGCEEWVIFLLISTSPFLSGLIIKREHEKVEVTQP